MMTFILSRDVLIQDGMEGKPLSLKGSTSMTQPKADGEELAYLELPTGMMLEIVSVGGRVFRVELLDGRYQDTARNVRVVAAPLPFMPSPQQPTVMCAVSAQRQHGGLIEPYLAAIPTITTGDKVYLIDPGVPGVRQPFIARSVKIV